MTASPNVESPPTNIKAPPLERFIIRQVRPTHDRGGKSIIEIHLPARGTFQIGYDNTDALEKLFAVGITVHDGGKFYLNDKPMELDMDNKVDMEIEIQNAFGGRKLTDVKLIVNDTADAAGLTDAEITAAWEEARKAQPNLETVAYDVTLWSMRVGKVAKALYTNLGADRDLAQDTGEWINGQINLTRASGDIPFVMNLLKKKLREDFPKGIPVTTETKFDIEGSRADVGLHIAEESGKRLPFRYTRGKPLEVKILGAQVSKFIADDKTYQSAKELVSKFFFEYDQETELLKGIEENIGEVGAGLKPEDLDTIFAELRAENGASTTFDLVQSPEYDRSLILAAHKAALEAFKTKDEPRFTNGIKDDADTLEKLNSADLKTDEPVDENLKFADNLIKSGEAQRIAETPPITAPAESPKPLTAADWTKWEAEQADNLSLTKDDIRSLLGITKEKTYRQFATLEDGTKALKLALDTRKLLDGARKIFDDFGVPAEIGLGWISGFNLAELADNWRKAEQFLASLKTQAVEYEAAKSNQPSALVPANPPQVAPTNDKALTTSQASTAIRSIPVPNPNELAAMKELASIAGDTRFYKNITNPGQAMVVMYTGFELGLSLTFSLRHIPIVNGSPWPDAECHRALALKSGFVEWLDVKGDATQATCSIRRKGQTEIQTVTYTIEDAEQAGLTGNATYKKHPADMLVARATIRAVRRFVPEAGAGIIGDTDSVIPEEE